MSAQTLTTYHRRLEVQVTDAQADRIGKLGTYNASCRFLGLIDDGPDVAVAVVDNHGVTRRFAVDADGRLTGRPR